MKQDGRYSIGEVEKLTGVSRRRIRHLVQQGLIPAALGHGRGPNYGDAHLDAIRRLASEEQAAQARAVVARHAASVSSTSMAGVSVTRICLSAAGVWLDVAHSVAAPTAAKLDRLAVLCRQELGLPADPKPGPSRYVVVSKCATILVIPDGGENGAALALHPGERRAIDEPTPALRKAEARGMIAIEPAE